MKYLAVLKDSLREALDSKVIYFTVGLSFIVMLAVASLSFSPQPAQNGFQGIVGRFNNVLDTMKWLEDPRFAYMTTYAIEDFQVVEEAVKPWQGKYRFKLVVREQLPLAMSFLAIKASEKLPTDEQTDDDRDAQKRLLAITKAVQELQGEKLLRVLDERAKELVEGVSAKQKERLVRQLFSLHGGVQLQQVTLQSTDGTKLTFDVETQPKADVYLSWPHKLSVMFGVFPVFEDTSLGGGLFWIEDQLVGGVGAGVAMLLSTVITAFFIPNMLRKGTIDLLLAKPIHRTVLLIYKYFGGLTFMFLNTAFAVVGMWVVIGVRSGVWSSAFLLTILTMTFQFAMFYAVSTLFGVLTRSAIVSILTAVFLWAALFTFHFVYTMIDATREKQTLSSTVYTTADTIRFVLPRYKDWDALSSKLLAGQLLAADTIDRKAIEQQFSKIRWDESLFFSLLFICANLGIACWWFAKRDY